MKTYYNPRYSFRKTRGDAQGRSDSARFKSAGDAAHNASKGLDQKRAEIVPSRRRKVNPLYIVIRKFWTLYGALDESMQNLETKRATLNLAVRLCPKYYSDAFRFWQDLLDEANVLKDSIRFNNYCKDNLKYDPQAVAEHLVVEGKATVNKVLKEGPESYGEKIRMFKDRLYTDDRKLYEKSDTVSTASVPGEAEQKTDKF